MALAVKRINRELDIRIPLDAPVPAPGEPRARLVGSTHGRILTDAKFHGCHLLVEANVYIDPEAEARR